MAIYINGEEIEIGKVVRIEGDEELVLESKTKSTNNIGLVKISTKELQLELPVVMDRHIASQIHDSLYILAEHGMLGSDWLKARTDSVMPDDDYSTPFMDMQYDK